MWSFYDNEYESLCLSVSVTGDYMSGFVIKDFLLLILIIILLRCLSWACYPQMTIICVIQINYK